MALGGTDFTDSHRDMFKDFYLHQAQQRGSVLEQTVMVEVMEGNKTFFTKIGSVAAALKGTRNEDDIYSDETFERRHVQEQFRQYARLGDVEDMIKQISNPQSELIKAAVWSLGRQKDEVILSAISGNAVVTTNGSTSNQALTLSIAVNDGTFDGNSADVGLTRNKLEVGLTLLGENYGLTGQRVFCVAPIRQLMNLLQSDSVINSDYRTEKILEGPGVVSRLSGFLGIDFIAYESTGLSGTDELAFLYTEDAIKLGVYEPLTVFMDQHTGKQGNPDRLKVWEAIGATRMYEEKVVRIIIDPLASA